VIAPSAEQVALLATIASVDKKTAEVIVARSVRTWVAFRAAATSPRWQAGKRRSGRTHKGSKWLRAALTESAKAAGTYLSAHARAPRGSRPGPGGRDLAVMLADGGDCLADLRLVREQRPLFGEVASDSTAFRVIDCSGHFKRGRCFATERSVRVLR
jgi:hypothetical protein